MPLTDNLVDWWDLAEASGNAVGAHAGITLTDNNTVGAGTLGGRAARDFERDSSEYFSTADSAALSLDSDQAFTLAIRAQWESTPGSAAYALISKDNTTDREFVLYWQESGSIRWAVWDSGGNITQLQYSGLTDGNPTIGTPYTIIVWHDPVANELGISLNDGTPQTLSYSAGTRDTAAPFQVGAGIGVSANHFDGLLGSVAYWKRVISSAERTQYYNGGSGVAYADIAGGATGWGPLLAMNRNRLVIPL